MPYTLAHPAAVLPLRSASRRHLALAPLAIGATMPDVQYFMRLSAEGHFTHTLPGLLLVCLPVGWLVLLLYDRFGRAGVAALLPSQWRLPDAPAFRPFMLTSLALFVGSVTHVVWDAFTHDYGLFVRAWPALKSPVTASLPGLPWYSALQFGSTIFGMLALVAAVWPWLREQPVRRDTKSGRQDGRSARGPRHRSAVERLTFSSRGHPFLRRCRWGGRDVRGRGGARGDRMVDDTSARRPGKLRRRCRSRAGAPNRPGSSRSGGVRAASRYA